MCPSVKSFPTAMIIFWGFHDFLVYLVNYLFKCFHYAQSFTLMIDVKFNFQCILYLIPPVLENKVLCTGLQPRNYFGKNIWQSSISKNKYSIVRIKSDFSSFLNKIYFTTKIKNTSQNLNCNSGKKNFE